MRIAVVGSSGQLGQDLLREFGEAAVGLPHEVLDVSDGLRTLQVMRDVRPDWVVNAAAFHRVDDCERNATLAFNVNALGALNVARAAADVDAGVTFVSTDYVFGADATRATPYAEADCPGPLNVYGASKSTGEQLVAIGNSRYCIVRTAGLYGMTTSRKGWTFPEMIVQRAKAGEHLRVVVDQILSPTFTLDLAAAIGGLIRRSATGVVHVTNAGQCSWFEFARATLTIAKVESEIEGIDSNGTARSARRPHYSALRSTRFDELDLPPLRGWEEALHAYLQLRGLTE